jgi:hypothetical protein
VSAVIDSIGDTFPRRYFEIETGFYRDIVNFIPKLRASLKGLTFRDDGAIDENGDYVFIETLEKQDGTEGLNCSGFAKFVVDGILSPLTKTRLAISPLKQKRNDRGSVYTNVYEDMLDPFFGLDWTRNLASRVGELTRAPGYGTLQEIEVQTAPFASLITKTNGSTTIRPYPGFLTNAGFGMEGLQPLLYTLAIDEPGYIYLASISDEQGLPVTEDNLRGRPRMRQYYHIAVLVPYFTGEGEFRIVVFESAEETSFEEDFKTRYPGHYINLVRIPVEGPFNP